MPGLHGYGPARRTGRSDLEEVPCHAGRGVRRVEEADSGGKNRHARGVCFGCRLSGVGALELREWNVPGRGWRDRARPALNIAPWGRLRSLQSKPAEA